MARLVDEEGALSRHRPSKDSSCSDSLSSPNDHQPSLLCPQHSYALTLHDCQSLESSPSPLRFRVAHTDTILTRRVFFFSSFRSPPSLVLYFFLISHRPLKSTIGLPLASQTHPQEAQHVEPFAFIVLSLPSPIPTRSKGLSTSSTLSWTPLSTSF